MYWPLTANVIALSTKLKASSCHKLEPRKNNLDSKTKTNKENKKTFSFLINFIILSIRQYYSNPPDKTLWMNKLACSSYSTPKSLTFSATSMAFPLCPRYA